jgi:hypothetical protein
MNDVEKYLKDFGEKEREQRRFLADPSITALQRQGILQMLEIVTLFMRGFITAIHYSEGKEKAEYYRNYHNQARSIKGI